MSDDLLAAVLAGETPRFHPNTGDPLIDAHPSPILSFSAQAGLEPPRFCQLCGRKMTVQVRPDGWLARCSRHGVLDSVYLEQR